MASTQLKVLLFVIGMLLAGGGVAYYAGLFDEKTVTGEETVAADRPADAAEPAADGAAEDATPETATSPGDDAAETVAEETPEQAEAEAVVVPSFHVLRVEPNGSVVIAGSAAPEAEVEVLNGSSVLATTMAGPSGDFAAVLDEPLSPGEYNIVLRTTSPDDVAVTSVETAIVSIPEQETGQVVALVQEPGEPSRLITVPTMQEDAQEAGADGETAARETAADEAPEPAATADGGAATVETTEAQEDGAAAEDEGETTEMAGRPATSEDDAGQVARMEDGTAAETDSAASSEDEQAVAQTEETAAEPADTAGMAEADNAGTGQEVAGVEKDAAPRSEEDVQLAETAAGGGEESSEAVAGSGEEAEAETATVETAQAASKDTQAPGETAEREDAAPADRPALADAETKGEGQESGAAGDTHVAEASGEAAEAETAPIETAQAASEDTQAPGETAEREDAAPADRPALADAETKGEGQESGAAGDTHVAEASGETAESPARPATEEEQTARTELDAGTGQAADIEQDAETEEAAAASTDIAPFIEAVEIDGREVFVAGRAEPGRRVRIYINDILLGQTQVAPNGGFLLETERDLPVGDYIVRADVVDSDGATVIARAAVPFHREAGEQMAAVAPAPTEAREDDAGKTAERPEADTGTDLAQSSEETEPPADAADTADAAGDEERAESRDMAQRENRADSQATLEVTDSRAAPEDADSLAMAEDEDDKTAADAADTETAVEDANDPATAEKEDEAEVETVARAEEEINPLPSGGDKLGNMAPALEPTEGAVVIRRGDTLWHISRRVYGRGIRYTTIYLANQDQIRDPDLIWPGQVFTLPEESDEGEPADLSAIGEQAVSPDEFAREQAEPGEKATP